jgi:predicted RND superfamily exporter protein
MKMHSIAKLLSHRPKVVILIFTIFTIFIGSQATNIYMGSDFTAYLPCEDPTMKLWARINEEFQIGQTIIIYIDQSDKAYDDIRDREVLTEMDEVKRVIYDKPLVEGKDTGIISVRSLAELLKEENSKPIPQGNGVKEIPYDSSKIYEYMQSFVISALKGTLYTDDYKVTVIIIQLSRDADFDEVLARTEMAVQNRGTTHANMTITGTVAMQKAIQKESMSYLIIIFPAAIILVSIVLFFFHRTVKGIIIAFLPPAFAMTLTFGILGIFAPELTMLSIAIVALMMGLGVDYSIHLMNRIVEEGNAKSDFEKIGIVLRSTGKAVLLSTVTTMIGFASLMISSMSPMVSFGFGCAIGIFFCFISAIIMVPCLVIILKYEKKGKIAVWKKFSRFVVKQRNRIIFIVTFLAVLSVMVLPYVKTDVNYFEMSPEDIPEVEGMFEYSRNFGGGSNFNALLVETDVEGLLDPDVINAICDMEDEMRKVISDVISDIDEKKLEKSVYSLADEIKDVSDIINRTVIVKKLSDLLGVERIIYDMIAEEGIIDEDFSKTIILVAIPIGSSIDEIDTIVKGIDEIAVNTVLPRNGQVSQLTGQDAVYVAVNSKLTDEQIRSMILALILVLAALIFIFGSTKYGLLTLIPVLFVLMWEPGFLVLTDIPLSLITISIAAIMVGIGIDYGVHITHRFREELTNGKTKEEAVIISIERTGLSLVEAAITTIAGMSSIFLINIPAMHEFVIVIIMMTALSCVGAALILPVFFCTRLVK